MQKSGERKISSASKLSRNYSFADKQERTAGRSKVVRKSKKRDTCSRFFGICYANAIKYALLREKSKIVIFCF